ncbi:hypothetical protein MRB53_037751 [Persea americana]|nr:hypothetical protein MRB53_037751 [Persea americana]
MPGFDAVEWRPVIAVLLRNKHVVRLCSEHNPELPYFGAASGICDSVCASLATLLTNVTSGCGAESYPFNGHNMSWVQQVEYFQYKHGLLCLKDQESSDFCYDVEARFVNVHCAVLSARGLEADTEVAGISVLWLPMGRPNSTTKCYLDIGESQPFYITDENDICLGASLFESSMYIDISSQPIVNQMAALDYYYERTAMIADDNYGWPEALEYDEYLLEIQCSSCWIDKFIYGYTSDWGDDWETVINEELTFTPNASLCLQLINGPQASTCQEVALNNSIPVAGLHSLNPDIYCEYLQDDTLCAPQACPIAVNNAASMSMAYFIADYTNFTQTQFLTWNTFLQTDNIASRDTVCVGPAGGQYIPSSTASQAAPSV